MVKTALAGTFQFILQIVFLRLIFKFVPSLSLSFRFREEGRHLARLRKVVKKRPIFRGMRKLNTAVRNQPKDLGGNSRR